MFYLGFFTGVIISLLLAVFLFLFMSFRTSGFELQDSELPAVLNSITSKKIRVKKTPKSISELEEWRREQKNIVPLDPS